NIQLGNAGDAHTKSYNLIRDTLFMGNDKLYHDVGNVFVTASAIMIPIGQTQSVVKGLTQFAIGEAGAYTAGQVAYHGTKLLGGSEEDAQTANFIGNLVGGYTVSSAASKFSLNKVKNNLSEQNFSNYREFSTRKIGNFKTNFKDVETKITVETRNAAGEIQRIQLKAVGVDKTGKIRIPDYTTAKDGLSIKRQTILDNIERNGGVIVGKGNGKFVGSVEIPKRTRIDVINSSNSKIKNFKMELEKIQRADMSRKIVDGLISTEKGQRLDPSRYLSHQEIETHLNMFKDGVVKVISKEGFNKSVMEFGGNIGPEKGHYVMPKFIYDKAVLASDGNPRVLEELLGLDRGYLGDSPLTINVKHPKNLRMPSGNEPGAWQDLWEPGGFTKGGIPEAVVDQFKPGDYTIGKIFE
ncbi:hypothetical protein MK482_07910, partial [Streptococcus mitis]|nr:hypothetical protein [Streptococcus mitis]